MCVCVSVFFFRRVLFSIYICKMTTFLLNHGGLDNRLKYYVGCSGWKHQTWAKDFYPATLEPENYLEYYSNIYDFAEVDLSSISSSSVYSGFLNNFTFKKWAKNSHDNFR